MNTVEIKLVINGKEAIATLQLTDDNVQKMAAHLNELGQKGANSVDLIRQKYSTLVAMMENVPLGSKEFEELSVMAGGARRELDHAEAQMQKTTGTTGNARMAVVSFSQTLSDSTQFQNGFRYGMQAISNNLEQMFGALGRVKMESAATGQTMMKSLVGALSGPAGIMIALSAVLLLLQILPGLFDKNEQKVEEFSAQNIIGAEVIGNYADAIRDLDKALKEMDVEEVKSKLVELNIAYQQSTEKLIKAKKDRDNVLSTMQAQSTGAGGFGLQVSLFMSDLDVENAAKRNKFDKDNLDNAQGLIDKYSRIKSLQDEIALLQENYKWKTTDVAFNTAEIEKREREIAELKKSQNDRLEEQAAITIRLQRSQVEAMQEGYQKQRAAALVAFAEAKAELDQELREKKISQSQYSEFLRQEERQRDNEIRKIEAERSKFSIDVRSNALKRMSELDSAEALSVINIDERIALSKATTEQERLRITQEFALRRIEAEAAAQQAILEIERQGILAKMQSAPMGSKERDSLVVDLDANDEALQKVLSELQIKKTELTIGFRIESDALGGLDTIVGLERKISEEQINLSKATTNQHREDIRQRIEDHKSALLAMSYGEKQFAKDVYAGLKDLYGQVTQLLTQNIQQDADSKLSQVDNTYRVRDAQIDADREAALNQLRIEQEASIQATTSAQQKDTLNKSFTAKKLILEKQFAAQSAEIEKQKEAESNKIKIEAFNAQKQLSYVTAVINIAEGITRILATVPPPFNIPLIALTAVSGAIQLATIASSKPPGLKEGGIFNEDGIVRGPGGPKDDKVNARLSNGEFVVNAGATARNLELLYALNSGSVRSRIADGNIYGSLRSAERTLMMSAPNKSVFKPQVQQLETVRIERVDNKGLEKKIDELIDVVKSKEFAAYLNRTKLTEEIEEQQRINGDMVF